MKKLSLELITVVAAVVIGVISAHRASAQTTYQRPCDMVGTGTNAWSFLIMEGESYASKLADATTGFTKVYADGAITSFNGNPVLSTNTTASKGGALYGQTIFAQYADKVTYQVQFATPGTYYMYMRFTMFENGGSTASYLNEDSFFLPPDFGKDPQTDWPLSDRGGYVEGGLNGAGFLWILEPGTQGQRTNHSGNDGTDQSGYWEGNFHWNQLFTSQFLNPDTQGVPGAPIKYEVTPALVGKQLEFTIGYREGGVTPDLFLFSTHTNLMEQYTQDQLDKLLVNKLSVQDPGNVVGTGASAWSYLIMEGEDYESEMDATPGVGFTCVRAGDGITSFNGGPILSTNTTASKGGALYGQTVFGQYVDKVTYQAQFATPGTYYMYMRFTMFENGGSTASYLNEDSFFLPPDFGKDPQTDWPLSDRGGYVEGGLNGAGFLWILEPGTQGQRTNHSGNDGTDQSGYWEGNFHWNQLFTSQFLNPDTQGVPGAPIKYEVTPALVGKRLNFTIGYREGGVTPDLFLFSTHTNLMDQYTQDQLDQFLLNAGNALPKLTVNRTGNNVLLSWPKSATGFVLESASVLPSSAWTLVTDPSTLAGEQITVTVAVADGTKFYRLKKP